MVSKDSPIQFGFAGNTDEVKESEHQNDVAVNERNKLEAQKRGESSQRLRFEVNRFKLVSRALHVSH